MGSLLKGPTRPWIRWIAALGLVCIACGLACNADGIRGLTAADMQIRFAEALAEPETLARTAALVALLQQLSPGNVAGAAAAVSEQLTVIEDADLRLFLHAWSAFDPQAALDHTLAWKLLSRREFGASQVIYYWAWHGGAREALLFVDSIAEPTVRRRANAELVKGWARSGDTPGVTEYFSRLSNGDLRDRYTAIVVAAIVANGGIDAVMRWAESIPDDANDRFKRTVFRKALRHVSARDPLAAADWYEQHADQFYIDLGMPIVATEWVEHDPEAAFEWLVAQSGLQRDLAMRTAMQRWLAIDASSAEMWMNSGERGGPLTPTIEPFAIWLAKSDPAGAVSWAERIPDSRQKDQVLIIAGRRWRATDPEAFEVWFANAELSERARTALERDRSASSRVSRKNSAPEGATP